MKMAPILPNFMLIVRINRKFVKIGSHFHEISLALRPYEFPIGWVSLWSTQPKFVVDVMTKPSEPKPVFR